MMCCTGETGPVAVKKIDETTMKEAVRQQHGEDTEVKCLDVN
jgi:hypothetical protein